MTHIARNSIGAFLALTFTALAGAQALPEGNTGLASRYPGDVGISSDPSVIFFDDFESYSSSSGLTSRWSNAYHMSNIRMATDPAQVFKGRQSVEFTVPQTSSEVANQLHRALPGRDVVFLRWYSKYDTAFNVVGSSHNGATVSAKYCCPGVKADGYNKFFVSYEAGRDSDNLSVPNPGRLNIYIYHPDQRDVWGDHFFPTGEVIPFSSVPGNFGPSFVSRPNVVPKLGVWQAYELMVKANTPGQRDGRIAMWLDGKLIADFPNLRLRDTADLKIDNFTLDLHVKSNQLGVAKKWYDNVVAASSYIGPMAPATSVPAPTGLTVR